MAEFSVPGPGSAMALVAAAAIYAAGIGTAMNTSTRRLIIYFAIGAVGVALIIEAIHVFGKDGGSTTVEAVNGEEDSDSKNDGGRSSLIPFLDAIRSPDFSIPEASFWSLVSSIRWVFGGMAGGVMAAVILSDLPTEVLYGWAIGLIAFTFLLELMLRASTLEVELKG